MTHLAWMLAAHVWAADATRGSWDVPPPPVPAAIQAGSTLTSHVRLEAPGEVPAADQVRGVSWVFDSDAQPGSMGPDGRYAHTWNVPRRPGPVNVGLTLDVAGTKQEGPRRQVQIVAPPGEVAWGGVAAGCALETACMALPPGTFVALSDGARWTVRRRLESPTSELDVAIRTADGRMTAVGVDERTFDTLVGASLCVSPNACAVQTAQTLTERVDFLVDGVPLADPLALSIPVTPSSWWDCWGTLIVQSAVTALVAFIGYGFYRPYRFASRSGGRLPALYASMPGERLRTLPAPNRRIRPRARGGLWWTDQRAYFTDEFTPCRSPAGSTVSLTIVRSAPRGGAEIDAPCVWIKSTQKLRRSTTPFRNGAAAADYKWVTVPAAGEALQPGYVYVLPTASIRTVFVVT